MVAPKVDRHRAAASRLPNRTAGHANARRTGSANTIAAGDKAKFKDDEK
jgi:hypothetical protein